MAALGIGSSYFYNDLDLLGHVFENYAIRDLPAYSQAYNTQVLHCSDDISLETDAIFQLEDTQYALNEIKTGAHKTVSWLLGTPGYVMFDKS